MSSYSNTSPYATTTDNGLYLDILNLRDIPASADDVPWEITSAYMHRPDLLSYDLYGDASYWWVFAVRNKSVLKDPVYDLVPGKTIYLPTPNNLKEYIG